MPRRTTPAKSPAVRVVLVTLDRHLAGAVQRVLPGLRKEMPGLELGFHAAADWRDCPDALAACIADIERADIVVCTMLFMEEHIQPVLAALRARRDSCDAMLGCFSAGEVVRLTRMGKFRMDSSQGGALALLKRLRGARKDKPSSGARQMAMLRRLPRILRFIPGSAQDVRAYFHALQYWLAGSDQNVANLVRMLINRYAQGARQGLRGTLKVADPREYLDVGLYHPRHPQRVFEKPNELPAPGGKVRGRVGVLVMRSYVLAGDTAHYDAVIEALEARGMQTVPVFASGLDSRPAIDRYFLRGEQPWVDAVVSLTGFSLVGGPAYNDSAAAAAKLAALDVPCLSAHAVEFQTLAAWEKSARGLLPIEATMMVAIPELDGSIGAPVYGGRGGVEPDGVPEMQPHPERVETLARRVDALLELRKAERAEKRIAIVLFGFPPNAGSVGTAAFLSVYASLFNVLRGMREAGYTVEVPDTVDALRDAILKGNAERFGTEANVHTLIDADDYIAREPHLAEIEAQWGPAPGRQLSNGASLLVMGAQFGNVFVGVQPTFGYEGDPMRLLFERSFTPTHAFSAFYRFVREDFSAHAVLHFGTHGALEFMPGKQTGLSAECWPERLLGTTPNFYLYAANNPSEGSIAKRRSAATLVSYLTPPIMHAGLYRELVDLKSSLSRWRSLAPDANRERDELLPLLQSQAAALELAPAEPAWQVDQDAEQRILALGAAVQELEYTLIPQGLHVVGEPADEASRVETLCCLAEATWGERPAQDVVADLVAGRKAAAVVREKGTLDLERATELQRIGALLAEDHEVEALVQALDGRFVKPAPSGDLIRNPDILPTGRNLHGFDPFRIPSAFAVADGTRQAGRLLDKHRADGHELPESIAIVLWGTDNLKTEGGPISQALALLGAEPRFDSYGRLAGATLIPLAELGRPRIDVLMTLSGIFRDLLPLQTRMLAEAALLAASADEPVSDNFVRKHALAYQRQHGCDLETAALRVFSNADGAYGSNVNHMIESGCWAEEDELAETYTQRKCFAYGVSGVAQRQVEMLTSVLADVQVAYQNLESVELGVTTLDHYFDTLGGVGRAVRRANGQNVPVYIGDQTNGTDKVRTLSEQVSLETRTRMLNPKWYTGMLEHGYEGVRQLEAHVTNTLGWSATTGQVAPWVYDQLTATYMLDEQMREQLARLNPSASVRLANRLLEAHERRYWAPDEQTLAALRRAGEELEDRLEGVGVEAAA